MHILLFDCSRCKKAFGKASQKHGLTKGNELTKNEWFSQCFGCQAFGIKIVDEARIKELSYE